ncbi:MAG: SpoVG family protein [Candidatus Omnitrophica bacterium]|nr:SpoVG family protein [Candidatus Omnitrophota bacterium]MDD5552389.1 SpoVG family protein [Candidatus Omnitrophota bacterium]
MEEISIQVSRIHRIEGDTKLKAFVDIAIGDFIVKGFRVMQGQKGLFVGLPQDKAKDGKWYNAFYPVTKEARQTLTDAVLAAYQE